MCLTMFGTRVWTLRELPRKNDTSTSHWIRHDESASHIYFDSAGTSYRRLICRVIIFYFHKKMRKERHSCISPVLRQGACHLSSQSHIWTTDSLSFQWMQWTPTGYWWLFSDIIRMENDDKICWFARTCPPQTSRWSRRTQRHVNSAVIQFGLICSCEINYWQSPRDWEAVACLDDDHVLRDPSGVMTARQFMEEIVWSDCRISFHHGKITRRNSGAPQKEMWREDLGDATARVGHPAFVKTHSQTTSAEYDILLYRSLQCASSVDFVLVLRWCLVKIWTEDNDDLSRQGVWDQSWWQCGTLKILEFAVQSAALL